MNINSTLHTFKLFLPEKLRVPSRVVFMLLTALFAMAINFSPAQTTTQINSSGSETLDLVEGGQRQRICIARALSLNPRFLICDESVSALDVSVQAQVLNLLNDLKREQGLTYIFISHDLSVVRFMSDRMMVMREGKIEEMGDADEVYTNPTSDYTRKLITSIPV